MFNPPPLDGNAARFAFLLVSFVLLNTAMTVVGVPHAALGGELASTATSAPSFRILLLAFLVPAVARTFNASIPLYYYEYRLTVPPRLVPRDVSACSRSYREFACHS